MRKFHVHGALHELPQMAGRENQSQPRKQNRCFIHGCINRVILINNEIHSSPPTDDGLARLGRIQRDSAPCPSGHETGPKVAAMQACAHGRHPGLTQIPTTSQTGDYYIYHHSWFKGSSPLTSTPCFDVHPQCAFLMIIPLSGATACRRPFPRRFMDSSKTPLPSELQLVKAERGRWEK